MSLSRIEAPTTEPLTLAELKLHCRVDFADDDALVTSLGTAARECVESMTGRALISQTWILTLDRFPREIRIPVCPVQAKADSVTITYIDPSGTVQTLSPTLFDVDAISEPARIQPAYGQQWPETRDTQNAITVTFISGYGDSGDDVPESLKCAIRLLTAHWYEHRELAGATITPLPMAVDLLCWQFRCKEIA